MSATINFPGAWGSPPILRTGPKTPYPIYMSRFAPLPKRGELEARDFMHSTMTPAELRVYENKLRVEELLKKAESEQRDKDKLTSLQDAVKRQTELIELLEGNPRAENPARRVGVVERSIGPLREMLEDGPERLMSALDGRERASLAAKETASGIGDIARAWFYAEYGRDLSKAMAKQLRAAAKQKFGVGPGGKMRQFTRADFFELLAEVSGGASGST